MRRSAGGWDVRPHAPGHGRLLAPRLHLVDHHGPRHLRQPQHRQDVSPHEGWQDHLILDTRFFICLSLYS